MDIIILNFISMTILFFIVYSAPKYQNVAFLVRLSHKLVNSKEVNDIIVKYKTIALDLAIVICIVTSIFSFMIKSNYFYISLGMSFYFCIMIFLFYNYSKIILKIRSNYIYDEQPLILSYNKPDILKPYHYSLHMFLILSMFIFTFNKTKSLELFTTPLSLLIYPICGSIILILFFIAQFKLKRKNLCYIVSLAILFLFLSIQGILIG